jgi:flagellar assembly protein FliH
LHVPALPEVVPDLPASRLPAIDTAAIEREAFSKGYAQGERTALDAAAARSELVLRQVSGAIDQLSALKKGILQQTERQVVQLSLAIARRIVHREVTLDRELVATMARVALDRMGQPATATIRLHPDDFAAMTHGRRATDVGAQIVADHLVQRGGCFVQSDFGVVDVSVDAQIEEVGTALLGELTTSDVFATEAVRVR